MQCMNHCQCADCAACAGLLTRNAKNMLNTFTVNHELLLEPSLQCVDTLGRFENRHKQKQANIESSHLIVKCTKVAARHATGSNQQPTSAQSTANGLLMDGCVP